ncbi:homoserine kinase [Dolosicoccus paucivorans]|uniref:Homoserine kinase n=1 Tax=Dolosicoccus paucivorans TaxID=84521 RepID=A0A1G8KU46_9LACT|nr:homoserine kinase [Dolosicoccus paucivorans]PMB83968.1 homoserine kinase [Dolosicoccus paucivorans]PMC58248.1 homoserine kinase [Dolosicoccus paucivorans]SDI46958.1 homoserine kinase [Dolosicoccus paucivorans]
MAVSDLFHVKVPATSANLGIGFDSMGIAVDKFLEVKAKPSSQWQVSFKSPDLEVLPCNEENLIIKVARQVAKEFGHTLPTLHLEMTSTIPLTHGLGSSASAIVAGVELANHYCQLSLSDFDKVRLASFFEGHPDNVGPCVTGGLFIGYYQPQENSHQEELYYEVLNLEDVTLIVSIPPYEVSTQEARSILPESYHAGEVAMQNAVGSLMLLAALKKEYDKMGQLMMKDLIHEPYRQKLIPEFNEIKECALSLGAYATVISGAGPTMLTLCPKEKASDILESLNQKVPSCQHEQVQIVPAK